MRFAFLGGVDHAHAGGGGEHTGGTTDHHHGRLGAGQGRLSDLLADPISGRPALLVARFTPGLAALLVHAVPIETLQGLVVAGFQQAIDPCLELAALRAGHVLEPLDHVLAQSLAHRVRGGLLAFPLPLGEHFGRNPVAVLVLTVSLAAQIRFAAGLALLVVLLEARVDLAAAFVHQALGVAHEALRLVAAHPFAVHPVLAVALFEWLLVARIDETAGRAVEIRQQLLEAAAQRVVDHRPETRAGCGSHAEGDGAGGALARDPALPRSGGAAAGVVQAAVVGEHRCDQVDQAQQLGDGEGGDDRGHPGVARGDSQRQRGSQQNHAEYQRGVLQRGDGDEAQ